MLKVINFLPNDYQQRRSRRRATIACLILGGVSVLGIGLAVGLVFVSMLGMAAMRLLVDQQYREASQQIGQLAQLEERKAGLMHKVELSSALLERVPRSHLLARLTNYLPPKTALMGIVLRAEEVEVPVNSPAALAAGASAAAAAADTSARKPTDGAAAAGGAAAPAAKTASGKRSSKKTRVGMVKVKQWTFRIDGLAPTDVEVAEYINRLTQDPLFRDVDLVFSEEFPYKEGVMMRKFQLSLRLGLDAEKVLGPTGDGGAAPTPIATAAPAISHRHEGMPAAGQAHAFASESTPPAAPPAPAHPGRDEIPVLPARAERPAGEAGMPVLYPGLHAPAAKGDS